MLLSLRTTHRQESLKAHLIQVIFQPRLLLHRWILFVKITAQTKQCKRIWIFNVNNCQTVLVNGINFLVGNHPTVTRTSGSSVPPLSSSSNFLNKIHPQYGVIFLLSYSPAHSSQMENRFPCSENRYACQRLWMTCAHSWDTARIKRHLFPSNFKWESNNQNMTR